MTRRIYLMRHGDVEYFSPESIGLSHDDVHLTELGRMQARSAGSALSAVPFDRVATSGLNRTTETADLVLAGMDGTRPETVERWPELIELRNGPVSDVADEDLESSFLGIWNGITPDDGRFVNGETIGTFVDRVVPAFLRLIESPDWDTMLLVLHGAVNRAILSYVLTGERVFFGHLEQSTTCVNVIDIDPHLSVRAVNVTPYDLAYSSRQTSIQRNYQQLLATRQQASNTHDLEDQ